MNAFIPNTYEELIEKCKEAGFRGTFSIDNHGVLWQVTAHIRLRIILHNAITDEGYMEEWYIDHTGKEFPQGHWHPMAEEIFKDLKDINDHETAILRKSIWGERVILDSKNNLSKYKNNLFVKYEWMES